MKTRFLRGVTGGEEAFTRIEFIVLLATLLLLAAVAWPTLAVTKPRSDLAVCSNNLRVVGRGEHLWASEHFDQFPWRVPSGDFVNGGGSQGHSLQDNAWWHYLILSNALINPLHLVCPGDKFRRRANDWTAGVGGFANPAYRNNAVSYFIGLDVFLSQSTQLYLPPAQAALGGDRNLATDLTCVACSSGVQCAAGVRDIPNSVTRWTNAVHGLVGNILFVDGRVELTSASRVARAIAPPVSDNATMHILLP